MKSILVPALLAAGIATAATAAPSISATTPNARSVGDRAQGDGFGADMRVVHEMLLNHDKITRTVTDLPNGIRTVTESDDPQVAKEIKLHVASMARRLNDGRVFNVASRTLPTIFANADKIRTQIEQTAKGVVVTQTSSDAVTVAALQAHAGEVSDLARGGMAALMHQVMANGGPTPPNGTGANDDIGPGMMHGMMGMMSRDGGPPMMAQMMQRMMQGGGPPTPP